MHSSKVLQSALCGAALALGLNGPALAAIDSMAAQVILVDYDTGEVLFCKNCTDQMAPSSMSKLMTVELVFQRLKDGRLKPTDTFHVSETAWRQGQKDNESKMWVAVNSDVAVDDLLKGIIVQSGGDACVVVAEALGGSEASFADMENDRAKEIGLTNSHFTNSSGLPDPQHYMSAQDLAHLSMHVIKEYPDYYPYFAIKDFTWSKIKQDNRNTLINDNIGVDGLKTGHTDAGGYGLVASSVRDGRRLIVVVNGLKRLRERAAEARRLLDIGYREFKSYELLAAGTSVGDANVGGGAKPKVALQVKEPLRVLMSPDSRKAMKVTLRYDGPVKAPIAAGQEVGTLTIAIPGKPDKIVPAVAAEDVPASGFFDNMMMGLQALLFGTKKSVMAARGKFITLEGGEGAGKSTQASKLKTVLEAAGRSIVLTREPGGSPGAEQIRKLLVEGEPDRWTPLSETLLFLAARADHVARTIEPALARGDWVISDRFSDSTIVYQGVARGLGVQTVRRLQQTALGEFGPDLTLILDIVPGQGLRRAAGRGLELFDTSSMSEAVTAARHAQENRFERFNLEFHNRLRDGFLTVAAQEPDRCAIIDGAGDSEAVAASIWRLVKERLRP